MDLRQQVQTIQAEAQQAPTAIRGLARNAVVYLIPEGLSVETFRSAGVLFLSPILTIPLLAVFYLVIQAGVLAVYASVWIALSFLIYDELRWQGLRRLDVNVNSSAPYPKTPTLVPWNSLRMADWDGRTLWFTSTSPRRKMSVTFDRDDAPLIERSLTSWGVPYTPKSLRVPKTLTHFPALALTLFLVSQLILILAAVLPFFPGEAQMYNTILNSTRSQVAGATFMEAFKGIFVNNLQVAWGGMLPVLGQLSFGLASYNTGRIIQAIAISDNYSSAVVLVTLYLLPHTWVEESAYPIATAAGLLAITTWRSVSPNEFAHRPNWGSWKLVFTMVGVALILVAAGLIETAGLYLGAGELLLWIPVGIASFFVVTWTRQRRRIRSTPPLSSA